MTEVVQGIFGGGGNARRQRQENREAITRQNELQAEQRRLADQKEAELKKIEDAQRRARLGGRGMLAFTEEVGSAAKSGKLGG